MEDCPEQASDGTLGGELVRLRTELGCERGDKAALRRWLSGATP